LARQKANQCATGTDVDGVGFLTGEAVRVWLGASLRVWQALGRQAALGKLPASFGTFLPFFLVIDHLCVCQGYTDRFPSIYRPLGGCAPLSLLIVAIWGNGAKVMDSTA